jgi:NitT/TauT family transport system substrate-binding protein
MNPRATRVSALQLFGFVGIVAAIVAVPASRAAVAGPTAEAQRTTVDIAQVPLEPTALGIYAHERGFFRRQGVEARIRRLADPPQVVAALLSGDVQFATVSAAALATLKVRGAPVKLVAAQNLYRREAAVVAMPSKRIRAGRDLVGKTIGIDAENSIAHLSLLKWLKVRGISREQVRFISIPFAQMLGSLTRGTVDAAVLVDPFLTLSKERGAKVVGYHVDSVCPEGCLVTVWAARRDVDANLAARFRNAIQAAAVWANDPRNRQTSAVIVAKYTGLKPSLIARVPRTTFATRLRLRLAQPWIDLLAEFGLIPNTFPASELTR